MGEDQKRNLEQQLWKISNELRGSMDASDFRNYILGFIFYKYLSEKIIAFANEQLKHDNILYTDVTDEETIEVVKSICISDLGYFLYPKELFHVISARGNSFDDNFIIIDLANILTNIEQSTLGTKSEDDFVGLFDDIDLNSTKLGNNDSQRNDLVCKVLTHLDELSFYGDSTRDLLGDAYEYLIGKFAAGAGKKGGEFYTPPEVSTIVAKIVSTGKTKIRNAYDPTCGSGSLLLRVNGEVEVGALYGQELNRTTYNLARMNMILHGIPYQRFDIQQENTLTHPKHMDKKFEAIVANPPFSLQWSAHPDLLEDERFYPYGKLAPKSKADYAFVQHMIHHLDENGTMAVVLPHGVLFRGSAEGVIRRHLIETNNYLDAVIGLPANVFYGTGIPSVILVFKKCREDSENILFIDASQEYSPGKNQNVIQPEHINNIMEAYLNRGNIDKFSYLASLKEVAENDYNLNIPRYVDTFEEEDPIDLVVVSNEIQAVDLEMKDVDSEIAGFCDELGIGRPF